MSCIGHHEFKQEDCNDKALEARNGTLDPIKIRFRNAARSSIWPSWCTCRRPACFLPHILRALVADVQLLKTFSVLLLSFLNISSNPVIFHALIYILQCVGSLQRPLLVRRC